MIQEFFDSILSQYSNRGYEDIQLREPHECGSFEDLLSQSLYRKERNIVLPQNTLKLATIQFIITCPDAIWQMNNCPKSILKIRSIKNGATELLGNEVASIATGFFRYYGSLNVFYVLREHYVLDNNTLIYK